MTSSGTALQADWLGVCRRAADGVRRVLDERPTTRERAIELGRGEGGDQSLVIDRGAEDVIFAELDELRRQGHRFTAVSEERGEVDYGSAAVRVVIDPIDGSMNAKRGLPHHSVSVAVAGGATMADVEFGYVYDFGPREEWFARRGAGAFLDGVRIEHAEPERRTADGKLELLAIESADPLWVAGAAQELVAVAHRLRAIGTIAVSLCQVAATRVDGMVTLWNCRAVDAAAGQLVVRESGGLVAFTACSDPLGAPLDVAPSSPVVAARSPAALAELTRVPLPGR